MLRVWKLPFPNSPIEKNLEVAISLSFGGNWSHITEMVVGREGVYEPSPPQPLKKICEVLVLKLKGFCCRERRGKGGKHGACRCVHRQREKGRACRYPMLGCLNLCPFQGVREKESRRAVRLATTAH